MTGLTTSDVAKLGGINVETVRFYERRGLLPKPPRTPSGYRVFSPEAVRRVRFIKGAQELGFSLKEIKGLLAIRLDRGGTCDDVDRQVASKLSDIDRKIASLRAMRRALVRLRASCPGRADASQCAILTALDADRAEAHRPAASTSKR